jgi:hypothetical protein
LGTRPRFLLEGSRLIASLLGERARLTPALLARFPELAGVRWRVGGLPPRVGGWCLGARSVAAITLWRTVWLARHEVATPELLLHELRHVQQFEAVRGFPWRYVWESLRRGYSGNRFEVDARDYARRRLRGEPGGACQEPPPGSD